MNELAAILDTMDIPKLRKDLTQPGNVRWLLRNMFVRNSNHPEFKAAIKKLRLLLDS